MTLDFRTKSIAVAGEGLTDDHEAVGAVERWYEVRCSYRLELCGSGIID
jgi:hypothetical protein